MQVLHKANEDISKLWRESRIQPGVYRLMHYTVSADTENGALIHNVITGELIFTDFAEAQNLSMLPCEYAPWMDTLIQKHFLVKAEANERDTVDSLRIAMRALKSSKNITSYTVLPTTFCNARCFYCYECDIKHETMTDETADMFVDFVAANHGNKPIHIRWFGGEPLVGIRQIDRISEALTNRNIEFSSSMTSNGYLFNEETVQRAESVWKLNKIQITLDGTETVYNEAKSYRNPCKSPYYRVLDNIGLLLKHGISVSIRLNLGLHNADDLMLLLGELDERFADKTHLTVYTHLLFDNCGFEPTHFDCDQTALLLEKKKSIDLRSSEYGLAAGKGKLPQLRTYRCMADNPSSVLVAPTGVLGKCEHYTDAHLVGCLSDGIIDKSEEMSLRERLTYPECDTCPLYPACIKLKICPSDTPCSEFQSNTFYHDTANQMMQFYEDYLSETKDMTSSK